MPTKKYQWSKEDIAAATAIDRIIKKAGKTNAAVAEALDNAISYNRVRDIRNGFKAPVRLSEFLAICGICDADPITTLQKVISDAKAKEEDERVSTALEKVQRGDMALAAYAIDNKQEYIDGEAGPDYDEPA
ncbi:hypothetical protein [Bifidobacterium panos]|uniref:HTH cro/C1-type domain-containing protein n=1 Tax=Bifidobacterium panos TaxID=2675321 RepID=A0ABX1T1V0_9BIFI|nr:hypothetical protein [Bifidobacterium sp. DSM 109963]NMN02819.1 hypothetical protein [Bifidobacterium sp. DSM 109963]